MALVVVLVLLAVMMLVTITLSGRMQQQLGRTRSQQEYQQALWYSASAESLALSALSLSLKNEKRVHLEQPWASGPRFFPLPQGQIAVTLRDAQACFNLNALAQPTTASRPLAVQQLIALISRLDVPAYRYVMNTRKVHTDDTPVKVLAPGQKKAKTGRIWTYVRDDRNVG